MKSLQNSDSYPAVHFSAYDHFKIIFISAIILLIFMLLQNHIDLQLADEGFLWYGAIHTKLGEIPIRDFQSYDPGRYYWTAGWLFLNGEGIVSLRISTGLFQFIGLTLGLFALRRIIKSWVLLSFIGLLLTIWMYMRFKSFEPSIAMAAIFFAVRLIENPSLPRHFFSGMFVGISAFFGCNLGLYAFLSFSFLIGFIVLKKKKENSIKKISLFLIGILLGYLPMILMFVSIPGFFKSYIDFIFIWINRSSTNIPLPVPWPWKVDYSHLSLLQIVTHSAIGFLFLLMPIFYILALTHILSTKRVRIPCDSLLISCIFVGIPYMHYAFSRADLAHLSFGIPPLLIGLISLPATLGFRQKKIILAGLLAIIFLATSVTAGMENPFIKKNFLNKTSFVEYNIVGDRIWIDIGTSHILDNINQIVKERVQPHEGLLIAPHWPTIYCILQRKSPLKQIYFLLSELAERQKEMIEELKKKNVNWVILGDVRLDGRDDLRFCNTHKLLWKYLMEEFESVEENKLPDHYLLLHRKSASTNSPIS